MIDLLAKEHLHRIIEHSQQALKELEQGNKRRAVGLLDEVEFHAEGVKWMLIDQIKDEEGDF